MNNVVRTGYLPHVDGLRAIAVVIVVLFHLDVAGFGGGYIGVDIFFVISGFLITGLIRKEIDATGSFGFRNFYSRRFRRLLPALFCTLAVTTVLAAFILSPMHLERFGGALASAVLSVSNIYFFMEGGYFDFAAQYKPLLHTWSLSIEEQFYVFWPILLLLLARSKLTLTVIVLLGVLSFWLNLVFMDGEVALFSRYWPSAAESIQEGRDTIFFLLPFRVFEFCIGAALVWVMHLQPKHRILNDLALWWGIGTIAVATVMYYEGLIFPSYYALPPCIATAMIIHSGGRAYTGRVLANRFTVSIGLISYSLYLVHWPLIVLWQHLKILPGFSGTDQIFIGGMSVLLACLLYRYVETPFRRPAAVAQPVLHFQTPGFTGLVLAVLIIGTGLHVWTNNGWTWRINSPIPDQYMNAGADFKRLYNGGYGYELYGAVETSAPPELVVLGDSHGRHYINGLVTKIAEPEDVALYNASGTSCYHMPGFTRTSAGRDWLGDCSESLRKALAIIASAEQPPVVILSHAWVDQMWRSDKVNAEGKRIGKRLDAADVIAGILDLKKAIGASPLLVIGNVPGSGEIDTYSVLTQPNIDLLTEFSYENFFITDLSVDKLSARRKFNSSLEKAAAESGAFQFLDPYDVLCSEVSCMNVINGSQPVYSDTGHLSKFGSNYLIQAFAPTIRAALGG